VPLGTEPKSSIVLAIAARAREARERLHDGVADRVTIAIVDFSDFTHSLLDSLTLQFDRTGPPINALEALRQKRLPARITEQILRAAREAGVVGSTVPRLEWLLRQAAQATGIIAGSGSPAIFDREALLEMNDDDLRQLIASFSLALADALRPDHQVEVVERRLADARFTTGALIAYVAIEESMAPDRVYDAGNRSVFAALQAAHTRIDAELERIRLYQLMQPVQAGTLSEEDSRRVLGLQVADVAAAVARDEYEKQPGDTRARAECVRRIFRHVLLNDQWLP